MSLTQKLLSKRMVQFSTIQRAELRANNVAAIDEIQQDSQLIGKEIRKIIVGQKSVVEPLLTAFSHQVTCCQ